MIKSYLLLLSLLALCCWSPMTQSREIARDHVTLMKKTAMATDVFIKNSKNPGPIILIIAGIHGNEMAGIIAARKLLQTDFPYGKIIILPEANRLAVKAKERYPYYLQDLNRSFPGKRQGNDTQRLAAEIIGLIAHNKPHLVIDLHEATPASETQKDEMANTLIMSEDALAAEIALNVIEKRQAEKKRPDFNFLSAVISGTLNHEASKQFAVPVITIETNMLLQLDERVNTQLELIHAIIHEAEGIITWQP